MWDLKDNVGLILNLFVNVETELLADPKHCVIRTTHIRKGFTLPYFNCKAITLNRRNMQAQSIETYLPHLEVHDTVSEQMKELCKLISLKDHEKSHRELIRQYMHKLLRPYFPDCIIEVFGSSVNGLGTTKCDLDLMFSPYPNFKYEVS
ncbi:hypothetical protein TNCT_195731 [Trichonephila clavata]|uniref:Poly(A) RNA polymerase mitochondrial-like central palm domain-containing protein n=1 Tax=Trichonephila clavata TaxID=2740835 RepID=A0A8X6FR93_TRICU|nr:hypothetical protein TNCT_195731 [Trichonephila clavata]